MTYGVRIMSNFHLSGVSRRKDLKPHSHGIERFRVLSDGYADVKDKDGMFDLMRAAWYSRTYDRSTVPFWYSEFYNDYTRKGEGDFTVGTEAEEWMEARIDRAIARFAGKGVVDMWHTGHCSVYDIGEMTLDLIPNETGRRHSFRLDDRNRRPSPPRTREGPADCTCRRERMLINSRPPSRVHGDD